MGREAKCIARFKGRSADGVARLESGSLTFRGGELNLSIPFASMTHVGVKHGVLDVASAAGTVTFDLGDAASRWAESIINPRTRLEKIGVRPEWRASAIGLDDEALLSELEEAVAFLSIGHIAKDNDAIFYGVTKEVHLSRLETLKRSIKQNGAIWIVRPKGRPEISEAAVMAAGKLAGLVDVKVVSLSPVLTAEKFVIPVASRKGSRA